MAKILGLILIATFTLNANAASFKCSGTVDQTQADGSVDSQSVELQLAAENSAFEKRTADIGPVYYSAQVDKSNSRFLLLISVGPDYTRGSTASLQWDGQNPLRLSRVDGNSVYKLACVASAE